MSRPARSLSARLTRMNLLVSGSVLLIAAFAFFSYDLFSFRQNLIRNLDAEAQVVGENSVSALMFNDPQSAATTLQSLKSAPDVLAVALTADNGQVFAHYGASLKDEVESHRLAPRQADRFWSRGLRVLLARRIVFQGKPVGVVYISATLREIGQRARQYLVIASIILLFCMAAALVISAISRRLIARPISQLAETALRVSRDRDYSVRARTHTDSGEIAVLVQAFNTMLTQIQERDAALNEARTDLEARVAERTSELKTAIRELEAFSYTVAHDLRGPLDAVNGIVFLLGQIYSDTPDSTRDPAIAPMLQQLKTSTGNMASLIDDLLDFARASTAPLQSAVVDLSEIAKEIAVELATSNPTRQVDFQIGSTPEVQADAGLMRIVLDNLLRNSWKYTSRHTRACIEFGAKETSTPSNRSGGLVYYVRDDGAGFDQSLADQLFQPFQRLHAKNEFPGTGIGLATVQRILARQGGSIWAEGAVEHGATFYFTFNN